MIRSKKSEKKVFRKEASRSHCSGSGLDRFDTKSGQRFHPHPSSLLSPAPFPFVPTVKVRGDSLKAADVPPAVRRRRGGEDQAGGGHLLQQPALRPGDHQDQAEERLALHFLHPGTKASLHTSAECFFSFLFFRAGGKVVRKRHKDGWSQMAMGPFQRKLHFSRIKACGCILLLLTTLFAPRE